ncbi:N-acetyltransferase [Filobacillus milosensis]|uniref:N-acetyltransferase n=1 Tax=Filobacillus milosensis TaxID=94137 RepID=A0A4Y8IQU8_9BACI|nr:GNAT family protein [Filobacillus milosensis]TFB22844.1 N-acetyltransferase [Filobacillus milosensis]
MEIKIEPLHREDTRKLLEFERKNRKFFEELVPSRGDDYYVSENFIQNLESLLDEQDQGLSYFYLIKDMQGTILGRMNLVDINQTQRFGHVGYRLGKDYTGKGIANQSLKLLMEKLDSLDVHQVRAKTTTNNIASQKVLEKNGFELVDTSDEEFMMNGQPLKFVYYEYQNKYL